MTPIPPQQADYFNYFKQYGAPFLLWVLSVVFTGWWGYRLGLRSQEKAEMRSDKRAFIPLIDGLIDWANKGDGIGFIRYESEQRLHQPAMRFRMHLKGKRLLLFNEAWKTLMNTTQTEVCTRQPRDTDETAKKMQQTILSRLEAVRKIVHDT